MWQRGGGVLQLQDDEGPALLPHRDGAEVTDTEGEGQAAPLVAAVERTWRQEAGIRKNRDFKIKAQISRCTRLAQAAESSRPADAARQLEARLQSTALKFLIAASSSLNLSHVIPTCRAG